MEKTKYYKVKFNKNITRHQWLINRFYDPNSEFWYGAEKQAMIYSSKLFNTNNRLSDFLKGKEYELILIQNIENEKASRVIDDLYW